MFTSGPGAGRGVALCVALLASGACDNSGAPPEDPHLVGGVDLDTPTCQQALDKLAGCQPDAPQLADRDAFSEVCERLTTQPPEDETQTAVAKIRACHDRYTCAAFSRCLETERYAVKRLHDAVGTLAALGPPESLGVTATLADEALGDLVYACSTVCDAGELTPWRARCERVLAAGLETLSKQPDDRRCGALTQIGEALEEDGGRAVKAACKRHREALRVQKRLAELVEHTAAARWDEGLSACRWLKERHTPASEAACTAHAEATHAALIDSVRAALTTPMQDAIGPVKTEGSLDERCRLLKRAAELLGGSQPADVAALCEDAELASELPERFAEIERALERPEDAVDESRYPCYSLGRELEERASAWAKTQRERLFQLCVVERGKILLPAEVPDMRYVCKHGVQEIYDKLVARPDLNEPELVPWIERAAPLCGKDKPEVRR